MNAQLVKITASDQNGTANTNFLKKYSFSDFFKDETAYAKILISSSYMDRDNEEEQFPDVLVAVDDENSITAVSVTDPKPYRTNGWRCDSIAYQQESYICKDSDTGDLTNGELLLVAATLKYSSQMP